MKKYQKKKSVVKKSHKNKILIVGHEYSGYEKVENPLNVSGLKRANALNKEEIDADEISRIILEAEETHAIQKNKKIKQIKVNPIWNGLALNLMLSNTDASFWGWSDSNAVFLLEYWKRLDSKIFFIFVYDTPEKHLRTHLDKSAKCTEDALSSELKNWFRYNKALLKFYKQNKERALLVNSEQILLNSMKSLKQLSHRTGIPDLHLGHSNEILDEDAVLFDSDNIFYEYFLDKILEEHPDASNLFDEMQSVANPPLAKKNKKRLSAMEILQEFNRYTRKHDAKVSHLQEQNREMLKDQADIFDRKEVLLKKWLECKVVEENRVETDIDKISENFMEQIFDLQEKLEEYHIAKEEILQKNKELTDIHAQEVKKEKQLKKWLECKVTEEARLEKYIDSLKEEKVDGDHKAGQ